MDKMGRGRNLGKIIVPALIVIIAAIVLHVFNGNHDGDSFAVNTTGERGASLLYDTLRHMGYPARVSRRPINMGAANHMYILIQPHLSHFDDAKLEAVFDWINSGGQLIFLHNNPMTVFDAAIPARGAAFGSLTVYEIGQGILVRGRADQLLNINLMDEADPGVRIEAVLRSQNAQRVVFAEYYQTPLAADTFFNSLPPIIRLIMVQLGLLAAIVIWYVGKRFGNPIPYYQEQEREENEHVHALARLYMKTRRKPK